MYLDTYEQLAQRLHQSEQVYDLTMIKLNPFNLMSQGLELRSENVAADVACDPLLCTQLTIVPSQVFGLPMTSNATSGAADETVEQHVASSETTQPERPDVQSSYETQQCLTQNQESSDKRRCANVDSFNGSRAAKGRHRTRSRSTLAVEFFICGYSGCIDRRTGQQKRFRRQEHRKRHERTVHERDSCALYRCQVRGCRSKAFTRKDNCKSHMNTVHGVSFSQADGRSTST
ncbi:uncharacterized protein HMPREF1541_09018 [Cyphellophora europaea CBS 101466]|uniref:C2H2-type domain-containing protein n=1 Tax=Cyphellophora europaea (strain CBS 101466) TaxID=1220924 RepID=W2RK67_CYPE1|nr:uncharacterized protein HMPREF1541_09018 [Cyphellophora europaea CBS 101466]ETN36740.1 hypothetical protein HMPREF1541_09018 [Cyphellophora europaea CBS 101466]